MQKYIIKIYVFFAKIHTEKVKFKIKGEMDKFDFQFVKISLNSDWHVLKSILGANI